MEVCRAVPYPLCYRISYLPHPQFVMPVSASLHNLPIRDFSSSKNCRSNSALPASRGGEFGPSSDMRIITGSFAVRPTSERFPHVTKTPVINTRTKTGVFRRCSEWHWNLGMYFICAFVCIPFASRFPSHPLPPVPSRLSEAIIPVIWRLGVSFTAVGTQNSLLCSLSLSLPLSLSCQGHRSPVRAAIERGWKAAGQLCIPPFAARRPAMVCPRAKDYPAPDVRALYLYIRRHYPGREVRDENKMINPSTPG